MRTTFFLLIAVAMTAMVLASPAKEKPTTKKACAKACSFDYTPVCGGVKDSKDKPISFGNTCVLENYNCENRKSLSVLSQGECPGGGGVRLA